MQNVHSKLTGKGNLFTTPQWIDCTGWHEPHLSFASRLTLRISLARLKNRLLCSPRSPQSWKENMVAVWSNTTQQIHILANYCNWFIIICHKSVENTQIYIPHICHIFSTYAFFDWNFLHTKVRKLRQYWFCNKTA